MALMLLNNIGNVVIGVNTQKQYQQMIYPPLRPLWLRLTVVVVYVLIVVNTGGHRKFNINNVGSYLFIILICNVINTGRQCKLLMFAVHHQQQLVVDWSKYANVLQV